MNLARGNSTKDLVDARLLGEGGHPCSRTCFSDDHSLPFFEHPKIWSTRALPRSCLGWDRSRQTLLFRHPTLLLPGEVKRRRTFLSVALDAADCNEYYRRVPSHAGAVSGTALPYFGRLQE
jgi:hypothetical protein